MAKSKSCAEKLIGFDNFSNFFGAKMSLERVKNLSERRGGLVPLLLFLCLESFYFAAFKRG